MASHDISPQVVNGFFEVSSIYLGRGLVAGIKNSFTGGRIRRGDFDMTRSRNLLKQHLRQLPLEDQHFIRQKFDEAREAKAKLGRDDISQFQKFILAMRYEKVAEYTFKIIESASNRLIDDGLMAQISEAAGEGAGHTTSNPFTDSHAISVLNDVNVHNLDHVRLETYRSTVTGEAAVVMDLHGRDASTQQVFANFSPETIVGDVTHREGESTSIHSGAELYGPHSEAGDDAGR
ncbi:hypothetical protein EDB84DRAFT_1522173 [Lactarius hengduanensis]|nr:hypothetical protein EDB84DRAFT_1522173 [Lactarius hengduanensis]